MIGKGEYRDFLMDLSDEINRWIAPYFSSSSAWIFQVTIKILALVAFFFIVDFIIKGIFKLTYFFFFKSSTKAFVKSLHDARFFATVSHIIALFFCSTALNSLFYEGMHPVTKITLDRVVDLFKVILFGGLGLRFYKALGYYYQYRKESYKAIALVSIGQTAKIFGGVILFFIAVKIIFNLSPSSLLATLGALTAVLVLIFRDTILGVVTGLHVATSKMLKIGDWIGIPKYELEGTVMDISLLTTKISNFDKTISTIPTYDLMTTEVKNFQVMSEANTRRIKRSIIFEIGSFRFLKKEELDHLEKIDLLGDYLRRRRSEMAQHEVRANEDIDLNQRQLTNIGVFRRYAYEYLRHNPLIDQQSVIVVRQLEPTIQGGLPMEMYCFTKISKFADYEQIQSDIFDHLLVALRDFDLKVMQISPVTKA